MENKKYDLEKAKEDCRRHEDALEEAQSCMCGHCHECGFDPSEMKAALDEVERLRSENKIISDRAAHHEKQDAAEIELLAARIKELEAEVEAKQANNEYLQKMTEEAQGIMQESQLLLCKEANEAEQLQNEVERLRAENRELKKTDVWANDVIKEHESLNARIKELEAEAQEYHDKKEEALTLCAGQNRYIERLEAEFLEATKEIVYATHEGRDAPEGEDVYAEKVAREAQERIKAGGKDEA